MIELSDIQEKICELILKTPPPGKHSARNAISHIKKAWLLKEVDKEMSVFRAITAEEEAATAIFHSLKRHNYKGANRINYRKHVHKAALSPFLRAIRSFFDTCKNEYLSDPELAIDFEEKNPKFRLRFTLKIPDKDSVYVYPDPPLNWTIKVNDIICYFSDEFKKIAEKENVVSIIDYIKELANKRNRILYSSEKGIPGISGTIDGFLKRKTELIFLFLTIFLLIDTYKEHQSFVQQALNSFLRMLGKLPKDIDFL